MRAWRAVVVLILITGFVNAGEGGAHPAGSGSAFWAARAATTSTSSGVCAAGTGSYGWMNDPHLTYAGGRLDFDVSWTPTVELVGYKVKVEFRTFTSTGATGAWQSGPVMSAWSTDCRYGPGHSYIWVSAAYGYEVRFLRQDGSIVDYTTVYGHAKTTRDFDTPPAPPTEFRATVDADSVLLEWTDSVGETNYLVERSQDGFATIQRSWDLPANTTSLDDITTQPASDYAYRIRGTNTAGGSSFAGPLHAHTQDHYVPDVPDIDEAIATNCRGEQPATLTIELCVREEMRTYGVYMATVRICETQNGFVIGCTPAVFMAPKDPPRLPDEEDPSVSPPPRYSDGSVWKPPSKPGEAEWQWGSDETEFPTKNGSWHRPCVNGKKEYLHWDSPHGGEIDDHWGYQDCNGNKWERFFDWVTHGNAWVPYAR